MILDNIETCDNEQVKLKSTTQSRSLSQCFQKRKLIWIIIFIVVIILIIIIPIVIIKTKKSNVIQISATVEITTQETTETLNESTTEERILPKYKKWKQQGITVAGGNGDGDQLNQLGFPGTINIDENKTILILDKNNRRIVEWKYGSNSSQIILGVYDRLFYPTDIVVDKENNALIIYDTGSRRIIRWFRENQTIQEILAFNPNIYLAMDKNGSIYICDYYANEVRRWKDGDKTRGTIVAGGNGYGTDLNQFRSPRCIFVDDDYSVFVSDWGNDRVMKWKQGATEGIAVAGWNNNGGNLDQLSNPEGVLVDQLGHIYVADYNNHRVVRWCDGDIYGSVVVGGNGVGNGSNQLNSPARLSFDTEGNLYVVDQRNRRVQKFEISHD
ncbi:unnamed protein product [Adineta steineri]|uniref:Uncharacterized protein n=1 Tax=Adineta steineri TaxID=433720 RepID=A0A813Q7Z2_9BILA|nr:unnamed protein product [Adineta steineri]CAF0771990.1 unnamed protein product [Adineta steineri]CAF1222448.1 unnamed protein product [Adineta steineri]